MSIVLACVAVSLVIFAIVARRGGVQEPRNRASRDFADYVREDA